MSPQERVLIRFAATGASNKQIAHDMDLSEMTVKNHTTSILRKLGVTNKLEALNALGWVADPGVVSDSLADRLLIFAAQAAALRVELDAIDVQIEELA